VPEVMYKLPAQEPAGRFVTGSYAPPRVPLAHLGTKAPSYELPSCG
jgi:hypothetical protein